jgi:hypothetical protein
VPPLDAFRPLAPSDFSFHAFDDLMADVEQTFGDIGIRGGPLQTCVVEDAVFVPAAKVEATERGPGRTSVEGSLVTRDGQPIDFAQARRRTLRWGPLVRGALTEQLAEQVMVEPEREIDEEVIYLGWYFSHFGHFMSESLTRTWFLEEVAPSIKVVFHKKEIITLSGTTGRILEAFGVPKERILFLDTPTLLRRVIVPEPIHELHWSVHERMPEQYRQIASKIVADGRPSEQPVYLSRRLLPSQQRQIVGEFDLEEVLRENGFLIAYPETMAFEDQVRLVNQHTDIFTSAGSAAYNVLFARNGPRFHFLTSGIPRQDYFLIPTVAGASAAYINCFGLGNRPLIKKSTPLYLDMPTTLTYLDGVGFLKKRLRASLVGRGRGMQDAFDELWLFAILKDELATKNVSPEIEEEAASRSRSSWPLSLLLAQHYGSQNDSRFETMVLQFVDLASAETDVSRLAGFKGALVRTATRIDKYRKQLTPDTRARLIEVLADRFLIHEAEVEFGNRKKARRAAQAADPPEDSVDL